MTLSSWEMLTAPGLFACIRADTSLVISGIELERDDGAGAE